MAVVSKGDWTRSAIFKTFAHVHISMQGHLQAQHLSVSYKPEPAEADPALPPHPLP